MLETKVKIINHKVGLLNLAEELGHVSRACKAMGLSRDTFYRYYALGYKTILQNFYQVTPRKHAYEDLIALQNHLDDWLEYYNNKRTHHIHRALVPAWV